MTLVENISWMLFFNDHVEDVTWANNVKQPIQGEALDVEDWKLITVPSYS